MTAPKQGGLFEDLIEVLYAPSTVFNRSRAATATKYVLATTLFVAIVLFATKNLLTPWLDAQADLTVRMAAEKGQPMPEGAAGATRALIAWGFLGTAVLATLIGPFLNALFLMIGGKVVGARLSYAQAALIAVLGGVPRLLAYVFMAAQGAFLDPTKARSVSDLALGPARFMDPATTSPPLLALLAAVDVTRVGQLIVTGIGVAVIARVSRGSGFVAAGIMLLIGIVLQTIPAFFA